MLQIFNAESLFTSMAALGWFTAGVGFLIFAFLSNYALCDEFHEELLVKPLPDGHLYHHFQFTTTWNTSIFAETVSEGKLSNMESNTRIHVRPFQTKPIDSCC